MQSALTVMKKSRPWVIPYWKASVYMCVCVYVCVEYAYMNVPACVFDIVAIAAIAAVALRMMVHLKHAPRF